MKFKTISIIVILALLVTCFAPVCAFAEYNTDIDTEVSSINVFDAPTGVKARATGKTSIKVSWKEVKEAEGYKIYRYSKEKKKFVLVKTTDKTSYINKGLVPNRTKAYKVRAYKTVDGKEVLTDSSKKAKATTKPRTLRVKAYAYTGGGYTALGLKAKKGVIAVDRRVISLGTEVYVPGYGKAIAADTGGAIRGNIIDCYMSSNSACRQWGVRYINIKIYD